MGSGVGGGVSICMRGMFLGGRAEMPGLRCCGVFGATPRCRCRLQLLNLLAAVHHQLDKHHLAALYLTTALDLHSEVQQQQQQQQNPQAPAASKPQEPQQRKQGKWPKKLWQQKGSSGRSSEGGGPQGVVPRQSHWLLQDMSDALSYNLGLQQLALHDWQAARECFEAAASKYFTLPQLWLRWAEACIGLYHQQQQQQLVSGQQEADGPGSSGRGAPSTGKGAAKHGKGQQQAQGKKQQQPQPQQQQQQQDCNPEQLLEQAAAHISTGLVLLQEQQAAAAKQLEAATAAAIAAGNPPPELAGQPLWPTSSAAAAVGAGDGEAAAAGAVSSSAATLGPSSAAAAAADSTGAGPSTTTAAAAGMGGTVLGSWPAEAALLAPELAAVKQSLLANRAYVALVQGQPAEALSAAQELLACSSMSPAQHYLGSSYAAEALCHLGRVEEARQLLQAHMQLFMPNSSGSAVSLPGLPADHQHQQQLGLSLAGPAGTAAGGVPDSSSSASALAVLAGTAPGPHMHVGVGGGVAGGPAAQLAHTAAGSTKSFDGSCISCSRGACGASGASASGPGLGPREQALLLHNMSTVLVLQGDYQEGTRHAALAADLLYSTSAAQQGPGGGAQPFPGNVGL